MASKIKTVSIGIDLGTSNYSVAINTNGVGQVLKDLEGNTRIPCCVFFSPEGKPYVGFSGKAKQNASFQQTTINGG